MQILVSACLIGQNVRYNGLSIEVQSVWLDELRRVKRVHPFCPEIASGLPAPRPCAEIIGGNGRDVLDGRATVVDTQGRCLSDVFLAGARKTLEICREKSIFVAILSEGSPSCGSNLQYDGTFSGRKIRGCGVTTALLTENGIRVFSQYQLAEAADFLGGLQAV